MKRLIGICFLLALTGCNEEKLTKNFIGTFKTEDRVCPDTVNFSLNGSSLVLETSSQDRQIAKEEIPFSDFNETVMLEQCDEDAMVSYCKGRKVLIDETSLAVQEILVQTTNVFGIRSKTTMIGGNLYDFHWNGVKQELYAAHGDHNCIYKKEK